MNTLKLSDFFRYKFVSDSLYSMISFIILALSGIVANIIIGNYYGAEGLGVFNQSLAIYMIASVLATFGINISVLKFTAQNNEDIEEQKEIFSSGLLLSICISSALSIVIILLAVLKPNIYFNHEVTSFISVAVFSLPLLTANKIFMALINAMRYMKIYAFIQSFRWILIIGFISISIFFDKNILFLAWAFILSESILLVFFVIFHNKYFSLRIIKNTKYFKTHLVFGFKSVLLSFMSETNNKIDIFFIGFFLSNYYVGVYAFASTIVKGFLSLANVVQLNINPIISNLWEQKDFDAIKKYTLRIRKTMFFIIIPVFILAALLYPIFVHIFMTDSAYLKSIPVFYILLAGVFLPSVYYFAGAYFAMTNMLNISFISLSVMLIYNALSCFLFIHFFGFYGAAFSTATTYFLSVLLMNYFIKKKFKFSIF